VYALRRREPADPLLQRAFQAVRGERGGHPVRLWLQGLAVHADDWVTARVIDVDMVRPVTRHLFGLRLPIRYLPRDPSAPATAIARVGTRLPTGEHLPDRDVVFAGLLDAAGLGTLILGDIDSKTATAGLAALVAGLPSPLATVIHETRAVIGDDPLHHW
jgi:hypothetical protein